MASNRQINQINQGRPLRPTLASNRTASKTPITPRLAANASNGPTSSATVTRTAAAPAPPPKVAPASVAATFAGRSHTPSLEPSLIEDATTSAPAKAFVADHITPRSSSRKSRVDSTNTTPIPAEDTPSHVRSRPIGDAPAPAPVHSRPKLLSPSQSEAVVQRGSFDDSHPHFTSAKARSIVNGRDTVRRPPAPKSPAYRAGIPHVPHRITKETSSMFFRADQAAAKPAAETQKRPLVKKTSSFFYANGQNDGKPLPPHSTASTSRNPSPDPSSYLSVPPGSSHPTSTSPLLSPPLSSLSSISPYFQSPLANSPSFHPPSPPKENIHLSYRKGVSQIIGRSASPLPDRSPLLSHKPPPRKVSLGRAPPAHTKSSSITSIDIDSPEQPRKRDETSKPSTSVVHPVATQSGVHDNPLAGLITDSLPPPVEEFVQSPVKPIPDLAAEARRERKVLDLEISNSSLLAINKSLEREIRKQKVELKRFRRLSRAGQFDIAAIDASPATHMSTLDEEADDDLLEYQGDVGRPSSPFLSEPADDYSDHDNDADSTASSIHPLSPGAQADKDALQRADDEERLRLDLTRHRELLLDTERMNKSLQRCLTWTEDLIQNGKKALEYQVPSNIHTGGRILSDDDELYDDASVQGGIETEPEDDTPRADSLDNKDAHHLGTPAQPDRHSGSNTGSGNEQDSAVELGPSFHTPPRSGHGVEFGKPTPLRNPLLESRGQSGSCQFVQTKEQI